MSDAYEPVVTPPSTAARPLCRSPNFRGRITDSEICTSYAVKRSRFGSDVIALHSRADSTGLPLTALADQPKLKLDQWVMTTHLDPWRFQPYDH